MSGYVSKQNLLINSIRLGSSFSLPHAPDTLHVLRSATLKSSLAKFVAKFLREQLFDLIAAACRSLRTDKWQADSFLSDILSVARWLGISGLVNASCCVAGDPGSVRAVLVHSASLAKRDELPPGSADDTGARNKSSSRVPVIFSSFAVTNFSKLACC